MLLRKPLTQVSMTYLRTNFRKGNTWANRRLIYQSKAAFVVTSGYTDPDHRKRGRLEDFSDDIPLFHVPNTLWDKGILSHLYNGGIERDCFCLVQDE